MNRKFIQLDTVSLGIVFTFVIVYFNLFLMNYHMHTDAVSMYQSILHFNRLTVKISIRLSAVSADTDEMLP